ncbi:MAG: diaminopimelate epimerase [Desulfamplus sp.]|nr:diaminopimelate epimerase [Desulfamplus sp.]
MEIEFEKMEGLGNDFILMDNRDGHMARGYALEQKRVFSGMARKMCDRHFGIGADGIILLVESDINDAGFRIFNSDGSEAEMCGNGMRCFAKYLFDRKIIKKEKFTVETLAGTMVPEVILGSDGSVEAVRVDMGKPVIAPPPNPLDIEVNGEIFSITSLFVGNPHAVIFVNDINGIDVEKHGRAIENHPMFPEKTNVEFIEVLGRREMKMAVWERGAGETLACGTGACAALVAANLGGRTDPRADIHLKGGTLSIEWRTSDSHLIKTGPVRSVFKGIITLDS